MTKNHLLTKIKDKKAHIVIIGMGYVGLPLAVEMAKAGFKVVGLERKEERVNKINDGINYIADVKDEELRQVVKDGRFSSTNNPDCLKEADVICICVPTPLDNWKNPDISYVESTTEIISKYIKRGQIVILESTTYPGTTEEIILPKLESKELRVGIDFFLAFSPERVDPGNKEYTTKNIPKVVGGITKECTEVATALYQQIVPKVYPVSSPKVAEMEKLLENIFRNVNIALVNELSFLCREMNIDIWEVIEAASTKPYGYMPFYPGPGVGGHCIPIDPFYLAWKAKEFDFRTRFIELAGEINMRMPYHIVNRLMEGLNKHKNLGIGRARILILGVAYKKDIADFRESPALKIIEILNKKKATIYYNDPFIPEIKLNNINLHSVDLNEDLLHEVDATILVTNHSCYDYDWMAKHINLLLDTRNAFKEYEEKIIRI